LAATAIDEISTAFLAICSSARHTGRPGRPVRAPKLTYSLTDSRLSLTVLDVASSLENEIERETQLIGGLKLTECFDEVVADRASQSLHLVKRFAPLREPPETFENDRDRE
jgi:hypothetical protein